MPRPEVFLSYSHGDEAVLRSLVPYLTTLEREGSVTVWTDERIQQGQRWRQEIDAALDAASIVVLLISEAFLASSFIRDEELPRILSRQLAGHLTVLPVFVSPSTVTSTSIPISDANGSERRITLNEFQGFGTPDQTLSELELSERQRLFVHLHQRIRELSENGREWTPLGMSRGARGGIQPAAAQRPRISRIPSARNRTFTGRAADLQRLHEELESGTPAAVTQALAGLGGIGKTQLALEYSYRYGDRYDVVWWIRAEHLDTRLDDFGALGRAVGVDKSGDAEQAVNATLEWLNSHDGWLLVFDNAESVLEISDLVPKSSRGRIIITSRNPAWGAIAKTVRLGVWPPEDAAVYLSKRTGLVVDKAVNDIAETLGYLPLALSQAAAYIEETGCGFNGYSELVKAHPTETLKLRLNSSDAEKAIATVWEIAFERVAASNPGAIELLNLLAFLPADRIPRALLIDNVDHWPPPIRPTVQDRVALDAAIGALRRYSLVDIRSDVLTVHRLVQSVVRGRLDNETHRLLVETVKDLEIATGTDRDSTMTALREETSTPLLPAQVHGRRERTWTRLPFPMRIVAGVLLLVGPVTVAWVYYQRNAANKSATALLRLGAEHASIVPVELRPAALKLLDQEIHFDDDGLIVRDKVDGHWDGGDTAQSEGWYWLGVWIRERELKQPWPYTRKLSFANVLNLLEQRQNAQRDGRNPKISPYNNPSDKDWGVSRDQMVPLVAAMGVWGMNDELNRMWDALPQDITGKHSFNGRWENEFGKHFTGDLVGPATLNLFRRAKSENPMIPKIFVPPLPGSQGTVGETELASNVEIRIIKGNDRDDTGDDLNLIVMMLMSKLRYPTAVSEATVARYARARPHSYGSYLLQYFAQYGIDSTDMVRRINASGWQPDPGVSAPLGVLRWYHRASARANPRLAELYEPILKAYIK